MQKMQSNNTKNLVENYITLKLTSKINYKALSIERIRKWKIFNGCTKINQRKLKTKDLLKT